MVAADLKTGVHPFVQVSRAIGDGDYKPLVTAQPDITSIKRNGTEDFIIGEKDHIL